VYSAVLADSTRVEPALARIARVDGVPRGTRSTALFWLAQQASNASAAPGQGGGDDAQRAEQEQAVYSLVRLPRGQGIPELVRVAREHPDPRIRRSAIFWLGSTGDPRAVDLFEELLRR
jgi:HEAT repeat protein